MPEFLKHFIVANSAVLFSLLLIAASIGVWAIGKAILGRIRRDADSEPANGAALPMAIADPLLEMMHRVDRLEAMVQFDSEISSGREASWEAQEPPRM